MKRILKTALWSFLLMGFLFLLGFTLNINSDRVCESVHISFSTKEYLPLVTSAMLEDVMAGQNLRIRGQQVKDINVYEIEKVILNTPHVADAKVYIDLSGDVNIYVKQRKPIARIFNNNGSFYLDDLGKSMPLSTNYSARVLSVTADFNLPENYTDENKRISQAFDQIVNTVQFINKDEFWKSQIAHLHLNGEGDIELTPRVGNHKILLGKASELGVKFDNLMNFYQACEKHQAWNKYQTLNLKYRNQIVCTKK